jgi:hypothetical protein
VKDIALKRVVGIGGILASFFVALVLTVGVWAQGPSSVKSQEVSEIDGVPVLLKHLPEWEKVRSSSIFATDAATLKKALGERPALELIDFSAGTEAVAAPYAAGTLLIVEYTNPQQSVEADAKLTELLNRTNDGRTFYKRTGNYNILVFDATDEASAHGLMDQVKYEKNIQWLGEDPFLFQRLERNFVVTTTDLFISTVEVIVLGMLLSIVGGLIVGFVYFRVRERRRHEMKEFSDAGGMTRLNLDGFTPDISPSRLLNE